MLRTLYRFLSPRWQNLFLDYPVKLKPRRTPEQQGWQPVEAVIEANRTEIEVWVDAMAARAAVLHAIRPEGSEPDGAMPRWNNGFLPGLDMAALHTVLALRRPKRYVEVGSGNSTKLAAWTARTAAVRPAQPAPTTATRRRGPGPCMRQASRLMPSAGLQRPCTWVRAAIQSLRRGVRLIFWCST